MKITIYTITDCKFSQAEKQYLQSKGLQFEEKNLEANREYLTEMLNISNNFAGTPVTKIEKDDGQIIVLKGFTQDEFDKAIVVDPNAPKQTIAPPQDTQVQSPPAAAVPLPQDQPVQPPMQQPPAPPTMQPAPQPPMNQPMDMNPMPQAQPQMPPQPMQPPQPVQQTSMMDTAPSQPVEMQQPPAPPAEDQALNSVLQNLQSRAGDSAQ